MKKNLLAMLLAVVMIAAVVFVAAPTAKAATTHTVAADNAVVEVAAGDTVDLAGYENVTINVAEGGTVNLVDTANLNDLTGAASGSATVNGAVAEWVQYDGFKYLAVYDEEAGTYSAHPFNLTVDKYGVNTAYSAVSVRVTVIADNTVAALIDAGEFGMHRTASTEGAVKEYFAHWKTFAGEDGEIATNGLRAYYYLENSFASDVLKDETIATVGAYIKLDGYETIESNQTQTINPLNILTTLNAKAATAGTFSDVQWVKMQDMLDKNAHMKDYCGKFLPGWKLVTDVAELAEGDKVVIVAKDKALALSVNANWVTENVREQNRIAVAVAQSNNFIRLNDSVQILTLKDTGSITVDEDTYSTFGFYTGTGYLTSWATNQMNVYSSSYKYRASFVIEINKESGIATIQAKASDQKSNYMGCDGSVFSCYTTDTANLAIYKYSCPHNWEITDDKPATCTEDGYITYTCSNCEDTYTDPIPALGIHSYGEDGVCTVPDCGAKEGYMDPNTKYDLANIVTEKTFEDGTTITVTNGQEDSTGIMVTGSYFVVYFPDLVEKITFNVPEGRMNLGVKVYVSEDGIDWGTAVYYVNKTTTHTVDLKDSYRYVKIENVNPSSYQIFSNLVVNPAE